MSRIYAPNYNLDRAMFVWKKYLVDQSSERSALVSFCQSNYITTILLSFYDWIGASNWSTSNVGNLKSLISCLNNAGIRVLGLAGDKEWYQNHTWVKKNILGAIAAFNVQSDNKLEGLVFDVEYWAINPEPNLNIVVPGFCKLIETSRAYLNFPVGTFLSRWLLDSERDDIDYDGYCEKDGSHLLRVSDVVFVGTYSNSAEGLGGHEGQISMLDRWIAESLKYGENEGCTKLIYACSETKNVQPSWITYYGGSKAQMESQHVLISDEFNELSGTPFAGQAIHCYESFKDM